MRFILNRKSEFIILLFINLLLMVQFYIPWGYDENLK